MAAYEGMQAAERSVRSQVQRRASPRRVGRPETPRTFLRWVFPLAVQEVQKQNPGMKERAATRLVAEYLHDEHGPKLGDEDREWLFGKYPKKEARIAHRADAIRKGK